MNFSAIIFREVVAPVERMAHIVSSLSKNPLEPLAHVDLPLTMSKETRSVERALTAFGSLLQLSFGEAGAKIIQTNMRHGRVDHTCCGKLVQAIFGFCDIRNFTDCTEALQGEVVKLVNTVAEIVHEAVVDNHGFPNKNIGDAFLLVWKPKGGMAICTAADCALRSYIRTIMQMAKSKELLQFAMSEGVQQRVPGYQVKMGFGLHFGLAVEGAIGSKRKIDASYLSPHVNTTARLEAATKQFGVAILMSEDIFSLLSPNVQKLCRLIDRVVLKGTARPCSLYTYDVPVFKGLPMPPHSADPAYFFERMQPYTSKAFRQQFDTAVRYYMGGETGGSTDWPLAQKLLLDCLSKQPKDGPSMALLEVMRKEGEAGCAPKGWMGYRELTEK
eukprot:CAMPEP_0173429376 /NCGR_PEP_ID=MMETSP1357-20121228/8099_1 /TAXON_ID=77926 /ORGANISM="Hemiselmis rufescens, Strain PCC563" /LENGTH=386 /DNA_ID=CAMNT_0014393549 /DNA_START=126 /DNA_END=1286 /DNA_ORIENTATION=+